MSIIKSFSVGNGDLFYINHGSDNFTVIDCNLQDDQKEKIMDEICSTGEAKGIMRFISTHPDEDHFHGIEYFDERFSIINFYCVKNEATKSEETPSFKHYCKLRDAEKAFNIYKGCSRKWMNQRDDERGSSGINILWPITTNENFKSELKTAKDGGNANNISPIIKYSLKRGVNALWFGDLETNFMESIENEITLSKADIVFAPHHGRSSGKLPTKWLNQISPKVIVIGEADSSMLDYYKGYNTITQNTAKDITFKCETGKVHIYVSASGYSVDYLNDEKRTNTSLGNYIGSFDTKEK
ncbi:MAG: hypothetical protein SOV91_03795 [Eubacteriales bacterium]|nr:hypothetical protein [Eubacteriales bacterium]